MWTTTYRGVRINRFCRSSLLRHFSRQLKLSTILAFLLCIVIPVSSFFFSAIPALAAPSITLNPTSGPAGTVITITGSGFLVGTSVWGYVFFDSDRSGTRTTGDPYQFIQAIGGSISTTLTIPAVAPGDYDVIANIPTAAPLIDTSAPFTVTSSAPSLFLNPDSGYSGTVIDVTGSGFIPGSSGYIWFDTNGDSIRDGTEPQTPVTSSASGNIPTGTNLIAPSVTPGTYQVLADIPTGDDIEASTDFIYIITLSLNPAIGTVGTNISISGTGYLADTDGYVWFDTDGDSIRDGDEPQIPVSSNGTGGLPLGVTLTAPTVEPNSSYHVRADIPEGTPIEKSAAFSTTATTMWLTVTRHDPHGNVLDTQTVTYQYMESNLPVQGDNSTRRYHQGPTFQASSFEALWDPGEAASVSIDGRDYGRALGTDVKDLCDLIGGAEPGDTINIKASDNFNKWFDYEDIYFPEPEQGKLVICWYNEDFNGYVPGYDTGMRLLFFTETQNPEEKYVFGDWDMHETLPPSRWHYFYDGQFWPSSSGLSITNVYCIDIYQPELVSCDASGNYRDTFAPGETVYVKGLGLSPSTDYNIWLQDEPVLEKPLDGFHRPSGTAYVLSTGNDPSGTQETVTTDTSGDFEPVAIWEIDSSVSPHEYDIVVDNQDSGTIGTYDAADAIDNPGWKGFAVTEITEFISFTITDYNSDGIKFGHLVQGDTDQPADWSGSQGAVTVTVGEETNVDVAIQVRGTDFSGTSGTIPIGNVKYDDDDDLEGASTLTDTYVTWYLVYVPLAADEITQVYYWITIPAELPEGDYNSTFYYKAVSLST
jgi:hypothetical protein